MDSLPWYLQRNSDESENRTNSLTLVYTAIFLSSLDGIFEATCHALETTLSDTVINVASNKGTVGLLRLLYEGQLLCWNYRRLSSTRHWQVYSKFIW